MWSVREASDGSIWTALSGGGLSRLDPATGTFRNFRPNPTDSTALPDGSTFEVLEARDGAFWVGHVRGLSRMDPNRPGRFTTLRHRHEDSASFPGSGYYLHEGQDGQIWVGSDNGIARVEPATMAFTVYGAVDHQHGCSLGAPRAFFGFWPDPEDQRMLWVGNCRGIVRIDSRTGAFERFTPYPNDPADSGRNTVLQIAPDPNDPAILWLVSPSGGLLRFDRITHDFAHYTSDGSDPNSLPSDVAWSILTDRSGTMWVGTNDAGLARFNPKSVAIAHVSHDAADPNALARGGVVRGMLADSKGRLWVGQDDPLGRPLVAVFDAATGSTRQLRSDPSDPNTINRGGVRSFAEDAQGRVWIGTVSVSVCDPDRLACLRYEPDRADSTRPAPGQTQAIRHSKKEPGIVWLGAAGWGLERLDAATGAVRRYLSRPGDPTSSPVQVADIFEAEDGILWLASMDRGLVRFDPRSETFETFDYDPTDTTSVADSHIEVVVQRPGESGILWLGTNAGIDRFDIATGKVTHFGPKQGMADGHIYGMLLDDQGRLWASTNRGISSFDPETETFRNYGLDDGLRELEFQQNAFTKGPDGMLYFGDVGGITAFLPSALTTNPIAPQIAFTELRVAELAQHPDSAVEVVRAYGDSVGNATLAPQEMGRVIVNLVSNAFDVLRGTEGAKLTVGTAVSGETVELRVSDNGPGVPDHLRTKIFEPFFTTKPTGEGTGLGLSLAHDIVTQGHGGTLRVEDNPRGGATFVVAVPGG